MQILFLSRWFPFPEDNGAKIRISHLIRALAENHSVDLISFFSNRPEQTQITALSAICRQIMLVQYRPFQPRRSKAILGFFSNKPRFIVDTHQPEMAARIARAIETTKYDLVIASEIDMAPYAQVVKGIPSIFEEIEINTYLDGWTTNPLSLTAIRKQATWWKFSRYLRNLLPAFNGWTVVSEHERKNLARISPSFHNVRIIPNGADFDRKPAKAAFPQNDALIYAGSLTYQANFDAVNYFLRQIFPKIQERHPSTRFYVTGSLEKVDLSGLPSTSGLILTGNLPDISTAISESWASVVPLRNGGGTRLKVLESLSLGTPVVSTSKGIEGLDLIPEEHVLVADDPDTFAAQVIRILEDVDLRSRLSRLGRLHVQQMYDWKTIGASFREYAEGVSRQRIRSSAVRTK